MRSTRETAVFGVAAMLALLGLGAVATAVIAQQQSSDYVRFLPPYFNRLAPRAQAYEVDQAQLRAVAALTPTMPPRPRPTAVPGATPQPVPTGISNEALTTIRPNQIYVTNHWQQLLGGQLLQVFAGSDPQDRTQGKLAVVMWTVGGGRPTTFVSTPTKHGPVRITGERGMLLTLQAADGTRFDFDATGQRFVVP